MKANGNFETIVKDEVTSLVSKFNSLSITLIKDTEIMKYESIGNGSMGKVYKGKYNDNFVAIKKIKKFEEEKFEDQSEILNEIKCSLLVQNEYIPKFYGLWMNNGKFNLVFEFISGQTLKDKYKDLTNREKMEVLLQVSRILEIIHSNHLIHRDIKPSNIMIADDLRIKLIDFGVSKISKKTETFTSGLSGTIRYTAPEYFKIDKNNNNYIHINSKIDIWSTGCMISEIFSGILPWKNQVNNEFIIMRKLSEGTEFPIPNEKIEYIAVIDIIKQCLVVNPDQRISAVQLTMLIQKNLNQ